MSVNTRVKKTSSSRFTLKSLPIFDSSLSADLARKPLFAVVGVADLAIEQVKDVPADVTAEAKKVQARLSKTLPIQVKGLRSTAASKVNEATTKATDAYSKFAVRGEKLVTQIRRQPATEAAIAEGKAAVKKAEAAATAAKRSLKAGERAVEDAAAKLG